MRGYALDTAGPVVCVQADPDVFVFTHRGGVRLRGQAADWDVMAEHEGLCGIPVVSAVAADPDILRMMGEVEALSSDLSAQVVISREDLRRVLDTCASPLVSLSLAPNLWRGQRRDRSAGAVVVREMRNPADPASNDVAVVYGAVHGSTLLGFKRRLDEDASGGSSGAQAGEGDVAGGGGPDSAGGVPPGL